jgi:collagenase-like PrtC family protease
MKEAVDYAQSLGIRINITFNLLPFVSNNQKMQGIVKKLISLGADNIIIADVNVMKYFPDQNIIVSTLSSLYNSQAVNFYTSKYPNISRIVLPRELSVREKRSLIEANNSKFEVLVLNDWCYNSNAMCSSLHYGDVIKEVNYTCRRDHTYYSENEEHTKKLQEITTNRTDCKVCSTYHYKDVDNIYFKIA